MATSLPRECTPFNMGGPRNGPPYPPTFGPPRRSRGSPLSCALLSPGAAYRFRAVLNFLGGEVFDLRRQRPAIAEGVGDLARAVAVELVLHRAAQLAAGGDGLLHDV